MTNQERYRKDPNYRARSIARVRAHHQKCLASKNYRALVRTRHQITNIKNSMELCREKLKALQVKLKRFVYRKEELEIAWGKERFEAKRAKREGKN